MGQRVYSGTKYGNNDTRQKVYQQKEIASLKKVNEKLQQQIFRSKKREIELIDSLDKLRSLSTYLQQNRESERITIAREIHDELGQSLTALKLNLNWLLNHIPDEYEYLQQKINAMSQIVDSTITTVQTICTDLRPGILDDLGILEALEWQANKFQDTMGINCDIFSVPSEINLDKEKSTAIFRIFQEVLTNVARHANATSVKAVLKSEGHSVILIVKDNGTGISKERIGSYKSLGLLGMKERARSIGGQFKITGTRGKGTTVTVKIPIETKGKTE
jgi:signal transduction histidine kinase